MDFRETIMKKENTHFVNGHPLMPPFPEQMEQALFGMGCFWGVERKFWQCEGVYSTAVGYAAGATQNPVYEDVCGEPATSAAIKAVMLNTTLEAGSFPGPDYQFGWGLLNTDAAAKLIRRGTTGSLGPADHSDFRPAPS